MSDQPNTCPTPCQDHPLCLVREADELARLRGELDRLHSWQGLLSLLDEHWPEDIFATLADDAQRDTGPRLIAALRRADAAESDAASLRERVGAERAAIAADALIQLHSDQPVMRKVGEVLEAISDNLRAALSGGSDA